MADPRSVCRSVCRAVCCRPGDDGLKEEANAAPRNRSSQKAEAADRYNNPESFGECLDGPIALLRGRFLVDLYHADGRIERRQDLPEKAFWSADEAMAILTDRHPITVGGVQAGGTRGLYFLIALSYRWTQPGHPDEARYHLGTLAKFVRLHQEWVQREANVQDNAVFWDFPCLMQKPRSPEQDRLFMKGLGYANLIYGHLHTMTVMQTSQPEGAGNLDYSKSGWCKFESSASSLNLASPPWYLDISAVAKAEFCNFETLVGACLKSTKRPVPVTPERMKKELDQTRFTNGMTDQCKVEGMYADLASQIFAETSQIHYNNQTWDSNDIQLMAEVLPYYSGAHRLSLWGTNLGEASAKLFAPAFLKLPALRTIIMDCIVFGPKTGDLLAETMPPNLQILQLTNLGGRGTPELMSRQQLDSFADGLAKWIRQPTGPNKIELNLVMCSGTPFSPTAKDVIMTAWQESGKNMSDLVWEKEP